MNTNEQIAILTAIQSKISEFKYSLNKLVIDEKQQLKQVEVAIKEELATMTIGDGRDWLNVMYWENSELATPVRNAYKEAFGGVFYPLPQNKEVQCRICKKDAIVSFASWNNYKEKTRNGWSRYICDLCFAEEEIKRSEQEQIWIAQEQIREQAEKDRIAYLRGLPYEEYLYSEHWQEFRKYALKRAKYRCQLCNALDRLLHVHHKTYENLGCEDISDVIVLCYKCHEKHHGIKK